MRIHVTRERILAAVIALGVTIVLAQGALPLFGEPVLAEEGVEAALETQRRGFRPGARGGPGRGGFLPLRRLDLSDAQEEQIDGVREEAREAVAAAREPMREARRELRDAMRNEEVDEGRIRALTTTIASLQADALVRSARVYADILEVLTPEQRDEVSELQERRRERGEERRERFRDRRGRRGR